MKTILFVGMADSVHTKRWIDQIIHSGWDIHLFPSTAAYVHPDLTCTTVHDCLLRYRSVDRTVRLTGAIPWPFKIGRRYASFSMSLMRFRGTSTGRRKGQAQRLAHVIRKVRPDVVHSLEIQHAGYLGLEANKILGRRFPPWIVTNWGSDIYMFGRLPEHAQRIRGVLAACDYYGCECKRDIRLARRFGFEGEILTVLPNTGGFDLPQVDALRTPGLVSSRRVILLKGYQNWAGRALVGLQALRLCEDVLQGYCVAVYSASEEVELAASLFAQDTGIPVEIIPKCSHESMLRWFGRARVYLGLSISDGIPTSLLEAIAMGAFPIQSCTSCASEWLEDGKTGLIVPPERPEAIAEALRLALRDDVLVDRAATANEQVLGERLDERIIRPQVEDMYKRVLANRAD